MVRGTALPTSPVLCCFSRALYCTNNFPLSIFQITLYTMPCVRLRRIFSVPHDYDHTRHTFSDMVGISTYVFSVQKLQPCHPLPKNRVLSHLTHISIVTFSYSVPPPNRLTMQILNILFAFLSVAALSHSVALPNAYRKPWLVVEEIWFSGTGTFSLPTGTNLPSGLIFGNQVPKGNGPVVTGGNGANPNFNQAVRPTGSPNANALNNLNVQNAAIVRPSAGIITPLPSFTGLGSRTRTTTSTTTAF